MTVVRLVCDEHNGSFGSVAPEDNDPVKSALF